MLLFVPEGTHPCWELASLLVIPPSNLFWYELLCFMLLIVVLSQRECEREGYNTDSSPGLLVAEKYFCYEFSTPSIPYIHELAQVASYTTLLASRASSLLS